MQKELSDTKSLAVKNSVGVNKAIDLAEASKEDYKQVASNITVEKTTRANEVAGIRQDVQLIRTDVASLREQTNATIMTFQSVMQDQTKLFREELGTIGTVLQQVQQHQVSLQRDLHANNAQFQSTTSNKGTINGDFTTTHKIGRAHV